MMPLKGFSLALCTISLSLATFMQVLDTSIANVALPHIAGELAVSTNQGTWVITAFAVGNAISMPLTGELAKRMGSVRTLALSTFLFTFFSWLCGFAFSLPMLVASRFFQGAVAGPLIPLSQSLLLQTYPKERSSFALSIFMTVVVVAPILGPILGGWIAENYSWRWIFYINLPVGLLSGWLTWSLLRQRETPTEKAPFDFMGLLLLIMGIGSLQVLLDKGEQLDWFSSPAIRFLGGFSLIALTFLIAWEYRHPHPLIDLSLFKFPNYAIGTIGTALSYMAFFGAIVITPLWLQAQMGYTASRAGLTIAPMGVFPVLLSTFVPKLMKVFPVKYITLCCFLLFSACYFYFGMLTSAVSSDFIGWQRLLFGIPLTIYFTPLLTTTMSHIPPAKLASASGIFHFLRLFAGGAGTSLFVYLWDRRASFHHEILGASISPYQLPARELFHTLAQDHFSPQAALQQVDLLCQQEAYVLATNDVFLLSGCLCLLLSLLPLFLKK